MDTIFPFGLPLATILYIVLYVVTLVIHVALMNYVLAGSGYVAWASIVGGVKGPVRQPVAMVLRDWLPFALGAAITAGVAPLLFVQILYKTSFYTANLLLFHRWMSILPALIVGFYLLYVLKSKAIATWPGLVRLVIGVGAFACFAYTAWAWTENHLLSLNAGIWPSFYESQSMWYREAAVLPRLGLWAVGSLPAMSLLVGWQMRQSNPEQAGLLGKLALAGMVVAGLCGWWYLNLMPEAQRAAWQGAMAGPWVSAALLGAVLQVVAWIMMLASGRLALGPLGVASVGWALTALGMTIGREAGRMAAVDAPSLFPLHEKMLHVAGLPVFLLFFVANIAVVVWCVRIVQKGKPAMG